MKPLRFVIAALAVAVVAGLVAPTPASAAVSFDFFYSNLSPHGAWLVSGSYGRVWQPAAYHAGWNPYYDGRWQYTSAGWAWDSAYAWGDIPYHYGTWVLDPVYGWVWVPGYTWAPAWVEFRTGPDYIGWAPVAPSFSVGFSFGFGGGYHYPASSFVFVHSHDFLCDRVRSYAVPSYQSNVIINKTKIVNNNIRIENNTIVNHGPDVKYVERATRRRIDSIPIESARSVRSLDARGVSRDAIRVNRGLERGGQGLRAASPVPADRPLPSGRSERFDRNDRIETTDRSDRTGRTTVHSDRLDRADRPSAGERLDRESGGRGRVPGQTPRMRDELQRGSDRQQVGTTGETTTRRGRLEPRSQRELSRPGPSWEERGDRMRSEPRGRRPEAQGPSTVSPDRERFRGSTSDEGRLFRGVRERQQPGPRADRSDGRERTTERAQPQTRSSERGRRTERGRRGSDQPKERKDHDRK